MQDSAYMYIIISFLKFLIDRNLYAVVIYIRCGK